VTGPLGARPAALLGLPDGFPDVVYHLGGHRYLLFALAALWLVMIARGRQRLAVAAGCVYAVAAVSFWTLVLGRPYGLLIDPGSTRRAAAISIAAAGGRGGYLAGEPLERTPWTTLAQSGLSPAEVTSMPSFLPVLAAPVVAALIVLLWSSRPDAPVAAALWLAFSTGALDAVRGLGLTSGMWSRPESAAAFATAAAGVLALGRLLRRRPATWPLWAIPSAAIALASSSTVAPRLTDLLLPLTFDQGLWFPLGMLGLRRGADGTARALALGGALWAVASGAGAPVDPWAALGLYRLGLVLAATVILREGAAALGRLLSERAWPKRWPMAGPALGGAVLMLAALPGSFLAWWDPTRDDPVFQASLEPLSPSLRAVMERLRRETPADAVIVSSPEYAPVIAVLAGRRVLRAPTLATTADEERRLRAERGVLSGRPPAALVDRYGLTHVFVTPGDFAAYGLRVPEDLAARGDFTLVFADEEGRRLYALGPSLRGLPIK
jgi:hypothetical protein